MRPVELVLERLENVRESGGGWTARCPAHDDRRASLSVGEGDDERALLRCHAGCEQGEVIAALGVEPGALFEKRNGTSPAPRKRAAKSKPAELPSAATLAEFDDALRSNDALLVRLRELKAWTPSVLEALGVGFDGERLTFPIRDGSGQVRNLSRYRPGGSGTKMLASRGRPRDLFPAPESIAVRESQPLFLVEGEPDAVSATELALDAVAVPGVMGWRPEWAERLSSRRVVVCFDADSAGRGAAVRVVDDLKAAGIRAAMLDLAPERSDGYDLGDLLLEAAAGGAEEVRQAGQTLQAAAELALAAHEVAAPAPEAKAPSTAGLLETVASTVRRFVVVTDEQRDLVALWALHAHALAAADTTPYLAVTSAEKRSGKSRLMELLAQLVPNPIEAASISEAALFRAVGSDPPATVLFDETDAVFGPKARDKEELRGLINAGYRRGARAYRCVGDGANQRVEAFPVFAPKALAGIGDLPETIADRCIPIRLRRRSRGEAVERGRFRTLQSAGEPIRNAGATWAAANLETLRMAEPALPDELDDRAQDGAEPLLAIADLAAGEWPARARHALITVHSARPEEADSWGVQLLGDIRGAFGAADRISTAELLERLKANTEKPWASWGSEGLTTRALAKLLAPYDIRSRSVRFDDHTRKGFKFEQFEDAFNRYLPRDAAVGGTSGTTAAESQKPPLCRPTHGTAVPDTGSVQTALESRCVAVPDKTPYTEGGSGR